MPASWMSIILTTIFACTSVALVSADQPADTPDDPVAVARAAAKELESSVNIYDPRWTTIPEPYFTQELVRIIESKPDNEGLEKRAHELFFYRVNRFPDLTFSTLIDLAQDPRTATRAITVMQTLPNEYFEVASVEVQRLIEDGLITGEAEELHFFDSLTNPRPISDSLADFAHQRLYDETAPMNVRVTAAALGFANQLRKDQSNIHSVMASIAAADEQTKQPAQGGLAVLIVLMMDTSFLESQNNIFKGREMMIGLLEAEEKILRRWAAMVAPMVAFDLGQVPLTPNEMGTPDQAVVEALRKALGAETDDEVKKLLTRQLDALEGVQLN